MVFSHKTEDFKAFLEKGNVSFFGYRGPLPSFVEEKRQGRVRVFNKRKRDNVPNLAQVFAYGVIGAVREERSDVYFLDHEATKVLLSDFPASAHYVCIRLVPRFEWFLAIPGLLRRLLVGLVRIKGIEHIHHGDTQKKWLVLEHLLTDSLHTRLFLSEEIGVKGFLGFLHDKGVNYVVLRFFEKLPMLYREGGDLDLLVADEDERAVKNFLQLNPGSIGVDVWTVSRTTFNDITYYPPALARKILEGAVDGPAGSRIPLPKDAFLALAYHVVYHKGPFAGVPSEITEIVVNKSPENDYGGVLSRMADDLGIDVDITMEALDEYLAREGWRPHFDTLAKIAPKNKWVWQRFFSSAASNEVGLGIFLLKKKAFTARAVDAIEKMISEYGEFEILKVKVFKGGEVKRVASSLRGGVWHGKHGPDDEFLPAKALLVLNKELARLSHLGFSHAPPKYDIRNLKRMIRKRFDGKDGSMVHATDNTRETWEYISVIFPDEDIETLVTHVVAKERPLPVEHVARFAARLPRFAVYLLMRMKRKLKQKILDVVLRI